MGLQPGQEAFQLQRVCRILGLAHQEVVGIGEFRGLGVRGQPDLGFGMDTADDPGDLYQEVRIDRAGGRQPFRYLGLRFATA
jgi:hypothetical protein